jgi:hypothetical protein
MRSFGLSDSKKTTNSIEGESKLLAVSVTSVAVPVRGSGS